MVLPNIVSVEEDAVQASYAVGKQKGRDAMRKVLLLAALSMMLALVLTTPAIAQADLDCGQLSEAEEQAVFEADPSDPNGLDEDDDGVPCEDDTADDGSFALPPDDSDPNEEEYGASGEQYGAVEEQYGATIPATESTTSASALPETGGTVSPAVLSVVVGVMLVCGGIASAALVRRG